MWQFLVLMVRSPSDAVKQRISFMVIRHLSNDTGKNIEQNIPAIIENSHSVLQIEVRNACRSCLFIYLFIYLFRRVWFSLTDQSGGRSVAVHGAYRSVFLHIGLSSGPS